MHDFGGIARSASLISSRDKSDALLPSRTDVSLLWVSSNTKTRCGCLAMAFFFCARFPSRASDRSSCFWQSIGRVAYSSLAGSNGSVIFVSQLGSSHPSNPPSHRVAQVAGRTKPTRSKDLRNSSLLTSELLTSELLTSELRTWRQKRIVFRIVMLGAAASIYAD
jgi:hypothetical protein